jgi:NAD(P)-dependent dehydrogenase (short-subunit alcohol dehydrogenase family)
MPVMDSKVILITGAGSGVGRATALMFLSRGWRVVLAGRRVSALEETVAMSGEYASNAFVFPVDVTSPEQMTALFDASVAHFGRIDVVFNNAGIVRGGAPDELAVDDWNAVLAANVTGTFLGIREAFRVFKAQVPQGGRIINNGSLAAHTPRPNAIAYTASKHAVTGMTKAASLDGRAFDIAVGQLDIGNAESDMTVNMHLGVPQPDGSIVVEPLLAAETVAGAVLHMAELPLGANVLFMSIMATKMPFVGRG